MRGRAKIWRFHLVPKIYVFTLFQVTSSQIVCAQDKGLCADAKDDLYTSLENSDGLICPDPGRPSWQDASTFPSMMTTDEQRREPGKRIKSSTKLHMCEKEWPTRVFPHSETVHPPVLLLICIEHLLDHKPSAGGIKGSRKKHSAQAYWKRQTVGEAGRDQIIIQTVYNYCWDKYLVTDFSDATA